MDTPDPIPNSAVKHFFIDGTESFTFGRVDWASTILFFSYNVDLLLDFSTMAKLCRSPFWAILYVTSLIFFLGLLGKLLFGFPVSFFSLLFFFVANGSLCLIFCWNRFVTIIFFVFLISFLIGYIAVKGLQLIPPVDDTLALMFLAQSDWDEIRGFLSWYIIVVLLMALLLSYVLLYPLLNRKNQLWFFPYSKRLFLSLIGFSTLFFLYSTVRNYLPYDLLDISIRFSEKQDYSRSLTLSKPAKAPTVVYFIGESLRADHLSINGYSKPTTPRLNQLSLINFGMVYSCATYTKASWLYLTQRSECSNAVKRQMSLSALFKHFHYKTYFAAVDDVAAQKKLSEDSDVSQVVRRSVYRMDRVFQNFHLSSRSFVILGHRGSHYSYKAYPPQESVFHPICEFTNFVKMSKNCTTQEIVNDYDNTIIQLDKSIYGIIQELQQRNEPVIFVFTSDHGEMLGEQGLWAHGASPKFKETHLVPLFFWVNDAYKHLWPEKYRALLQNSKKFQNRVRHDNLWFSLLDGIGVIDTSSRGVLDPHKSLFDPEYIPNISKNWNHPEYPRN